MKKTRIALAISSTLFAASAMATNGTNMIGFGAQSKALGGTGTALHFESESVVNNPGLIGKETGTSFAFGGTLFMPSVTNNGGNPTAESSSAADTHVIPSVSLTSRINENLTFGVGMFGTSGMGVDYSTETNPALAGTMKAQSQMQIMKFIPTIAYNSNNFGVGFSPVIQYGSLDIHYIIPAGTGGLTADKSVGTGIASDLGFGFNIGGYFDVNDQLTIAVSYESAISMDYSKQLSTASQPFVDFGMLPSAFGDTLEQPAVMKAGVAYDMGNIVLTGDLKQIMWGEAEGYKDFNWQNQTVIALGGKYIGDGFWVGAGYNKADNPIKEIPAATAGGLATNMFNNLFFPATPESHITFGGGYNLTKQVAINAAMVIAPKTTTSVVVSNMAGGTTTNTTTHSQVGYTFDISYSF